MAKAAINVKSSASKVAPKTIKKAQKSIKKLWERKKLAVGQYLSELAYYQVKKIAGKTVEVESSVGGEISVDFDLIKEMDSAQHHAKEVASTMTQLVEVLETAKDTVFKVTFRKQANVDNAAKVLDGVSLADLKNTAKKSAIADQIASGERSTMICRMIELQTILGRSTVLDLSADTENKFRQIDHRTIESIVLRNVLYTLKKAGAKSTATSDEVKKDAPKWDYSKLRVGDWFSGTTYYRVAAISKDEVDLEANSEIIGVTGELPETEMHNSSVFDSEEKLSLTRIAEILVGANTKCFTVCFNTKTDKDIVSEQLGKVT